MAAGHRGLLAFWIGGAAAAPVSTQAGRRSQLAPWIGGASAPAAGVTQAGTRGLLAPWIGGASAPAATGTQAGYRGLLGFWAGGYNAGPAGTPTPDEHPLLGGPDRIHDPRRRIDFTDDDLFRIAAAIIFSGCLDD